MKRKSEHTDGCGCPFKKRFEVGHVGKKLKKVTLLQSQFLSRVSVYDQICKDCRILFDEKFNKKVSPNVGKLIRSNTSTTTHNFFSNLIFYYRKYCLQ